MLGTPLYNRLGSADRRLSFGERATVDAALVGSDTAEAERRLDLAPAANLSASWSSRHVGL